jgi:hypothetical protein
VELRRSPFKVNTVESDPRAFALRAKEIELAGDALFNNRSILISGPRGIGKSSLGNQLQQVLRGDQTLLERCGISTMMPVHVCLFHACAPEASLEDLIADLLFDLQTAVQTAAVKFNQKHEFNLGFWKGTFEKQDGEKRGPGTLAAKFVAGVSETMSALAEAHVVDCGINIMLDEVDRLHTNINFGHFMKVLHETLARENLLHVSFIVAGQQGVYTRFLTEDPSFERIVRHIPISVLNRESSEYVLQFAARNAKPPYAMDERAEQLMLALASGFPYLLHLLGDAAFRAMRDPTAMSEADVLNGLEGVLQSDKREKYVARLSALSQDARDLLILLSGCVVTRIPAEMPLKWARSMASGEISKPDRFSAALAELIRQGDVVLMKGETHVRFSEELFRVFLALGRIERQQLLAQRAELAQLRRSQNKDLSKVPDEEADLEAQARLVSMEGLKSVIKNAKCSYSWEEDQMFQLYHGKRV